MFAVLLGLLPTLGWPTTTVVQDGRSDQVAIDACISAVQIYFPCLSTAPTNHTCLCEQYTWHVACYDNHAFTPSSFPGRFTAATQMDDYCRAAGSIGAVNVQRKYHLQSRQINSFLSSIGGVVNSFLSSQSVTIAIPSAIPSLLVPSTTPSASTTRQATSATSSATSSAPTLASNSLTSSFATSTSKSTRSNSDASESTASSSSISSPAASSKSKSGPSIGLIAGAVIGGVAVLVLIGILAMLILRQKKKKRSSSLQNSRRGGGTSNEKSIEDVERANAGGRVVGSPMQPEKVCYAQMEPTWSNRGSEMETSANTWEIDGRERPVYEMESPYPDRRSLGKDWSHRPITPATPVTPVSYHGPALTDELFLPNCTVPGTAV